MESVCAKRRTTGVRKRIRLLLTLVALCLPAAAAAQSRNPSAAPHWLRAASRSPVAVPPERGFGIPQTLPPGDTVGEVTNGFVRTVVQVRPAPVPSVTPDKRTSAEAVPGAASGRQDTGIVPRRRPSTKAVATASDALTRSAKYILRDTAADERLELRVGLPRVMTFRQPPLRTYIPESGTDIVALRYIDPQAPHRVAIEPLSAGITSLTMWFADPSAPDGEDAVSWQVVVTDTQNCDHELELAAVEREINYSFPNSAVELRYVGSQVLVRGKARDVEEASQILRIVSGSLPCTQQDRADAFVDRADLLFADVESIEEAGSLPGAFRGDNRTGFNQGRINNRVINMLEIAGIHQVMLKVTVAEINRSASRLIGADLEIGSVGDAVRFFTTLNTQTLGGTLVLDQSDFQLAISALKRLNLARSLAEPTLTTLNGQPATFNVGGSFPVPVVAGQTAVGLQGVEFQNFGVQLRFVPIVTDGDRIRLTLQASVSTRDEAGETQIGTATVPALSNRQFSNTVELREGQTLAVAGLIQSNLGGQSQRVPFAGDIPIVGRLFANDATTYDEQELVVLVTPYLAGPVDPEVHSPPLPGSDYFEPDDIEFFIRGSLTGHIAEDYRSPVRTDLHKMKAFRRCEQMLIIGQPGHSNGLLCPPAHLPNDTAGIARVNPPPIPEYTDESQEFTPGPVESSEGFDE